MDPAARWPGDSAVPGGLHTDRPSASARKEKKMRRNWWGLALLSALAVGATACGGDDSSSDADVTGDDAGADADADGDGDADADADADGDDVPAETEADVAEETTDVPADVIEDEGTGDADGDGGPVAPDWTCVGSVVVPTPTETSVEFTGTIIDYVTSAPLEGATVKVCASDDLPCTTPLDTATTDAAGQGMVTLPFGTTGFAGFFDVQQTGYLPMLRWIYPPMTTLPPPEAGAQAMLDTTTAGMMAALLGTTIDSARGELLVTALDCALLRAVGVSGEVDTADGSSMAFYIAGSLPSATATETDASGTLGWLNLPAGPAVLTLHRADTGATVAQATLGIRAGAASMIALSPTP
jgi:hypothetical protein